MSLLSPLETTFLTGRGVAMAILPFGKNSDVTSEDEAIPIQDSFALLGMTMMVKIFMGHYTIMPNL